jgi:hypothetical protein
MGEASIVMKPQSFHGKSTLHTKYSFKKNPPPPLPHKLERKKARYLLECMLGAFPVAA